VSETALLSSYKNTEDDDALKWLRSYNTQNAQKPTKPEAPAKPPEPVKPGGFFNRATQGIADFLYPKAPVEGAGTARRIMESAAKPVGEGYGQIVNAAADTTPTDGPEGHTLELPGGINVPVPHAVHRIGQAVQGAMGLTPVGAVFGAAKGTGQEVQGGMEQLSPSLTDEKLDERIASLKASIASGSTDALSKTGASQQTVASQQEMVKQLELLKKKPYDERVKMAQEDTGSMFELAVGAMPMPFFLGAGSGAAKLIAGPAQAATEAGRLARIEAMRQAGETFAAAHAEAQTAKQAAAAAPAAGAPKPPLTLNDVRQGMQPETTPGVKAGAGSPGQNISPEVMTLDKLHAQQRLSMLQRDPAASEAMASIPEASTLVSEPGADRIAGKTTRDQLREQNRTPLDAAPRQLHPYAPVEQMDEESTRIAREYDAAITDPKSKPAWDSLAADTEQMYGEIAKKIKIEKVTGQPYASAEEMVADMKKGVFKVTTDNSQHPFWTEDQNWKFRVVHDYLGHFETGADFSLAGEKKAFLAHAAQLSSEPAKQALQSEVVGQAASYTANAGKFPEQKAFIPQEKVAAVAADHAEQIARETNNGGASFSMADGRLRRGDEGGFYVAVAPERMTTISGRAVSASDISRFAEQNADKLAQPGAHIGTEKLPDGTVNLDISVRTDKADEALQLAQQHKQERIWDATLNKPIDVPQGNQPVKVKAYHGTSSTYEDYKGSQFFAENPETANHYANREMLDSGAPAGDAPQVRPVSLTLDHPATEAQFREALDLMQGDRQLAEELLKSKGYDGVAYRGTDTGKGPHYLAFDAAKSATPFYGQAASSLPTAVDAAQKRIMDRLKAMGGALTDETGSFQLRGSFTEGWEKNKQLINDLSIVGSHYLWENPLRSFKDWSAAMVEKYGNQIGPQLQTIYDLARKQMSKFKVSAKDMPAADQMMKDINAGKPAWPWYDDAKAEFETMFGSNAELFAKVYAATSPMMQADSSNIAMAFKAMDMIMSGERHEGALFRGADGFIGAHVNNLNRVLRNEPLSGPKVGEFFPAIWGDRNANVVDRWMGRYFNFLKGPEDKRSMNDSQIKFIQLAVEAGSKEMGVDVRGGQAALWAVQKAVTEGKDISEVSTPLHELIANYIKKNEIEREWIFPKAIEEAMPSWVTEEGKIQMGTYVVLGRAAISGVLGSMTGEDPESAIRNGLLAAGLGAVLSPKLARSMFEQLSKPEVLDALKAGLKDETGAINVKWPKPAEKSPNTSRMGASVGAKQLVRGINEKLSEAGRLDRDIVKPFEQTRAEAAKSPFNTVEGVLGMDKAQLTLDELDGAITAARDVRDAALESTITKMARAKVTQDADLAKDAVSEFLLTGRISEQVTNAQTAYGRGLGAQRMQSKAARASSKYNLDDLDTDLQEMRKALVERGNVSDLQVVDMVTQMADKAATAKIAETASKWPEALWNIYYGLNLLGSPLTQFRNVIGNMGGLSMAVADRAFGEMIAAPFHLAGNPAGWGTGMVQAGETYQLAKGLWQVVGDTFRSAKDAQAVPGGMRSAFLDSYRTGESSFVNGGSKASEMLRTLETAQANGNGSLPYLIQAMSTLAQKNMRVMGAADEVFKTLSFQAELRALALREVKTNPMYEGKALAQEIENLVDHPTKDMLAMAEAAAHENTFTKAFSSVPTDQQGWQNVWGLGTQIEKVAQNKFMRAVVSPFFRTPVRIAEYSTVHTPGLNFLAAQFHSDIAAGGVKANMALAKLATGSAVIGLVGWYAAHGYITGDWPDDPKLKAAYERAGWQPKSVYMPFLGKYISYDNFEPLSTLIGTTANVIQMSRDLPDWHIDTLMMAGSIAAAKSSISKQWFQGVSDIVDVIEGMRTGDSVEKGAKWLANRLASYVPGAAIGRLAANMSDTEKRDFKSVSDNENPEVREFEILKNVLKAEVPGWSKTRPAIPNMLTGEPLPNENSWFGGLSPARISTLKNDPVLRESVSLGGAGLPKELPRAIGGSAPPSPYKFQGDEERQVREGVLMNDKERARLGTILTKEIEDENGNNLHDSLLEMIQSDEYKDQSDGPNGGKALMWGERFHGFMEQAQRKLLDENSRLDAAVTHRKLLRDLGKLPNSQQDQKGDIMEQVMGAVGQQ
jgi:hypothetical protein